MEARVAFPQTFSLPRCGFSAFLRARPSQIRVNHPKSHRVRQQATADPRTLPQQPKRAGAAGQTAAALQVEDVPFGAGALIWGCAAQGAQRGGSRRGAGVGGHGAAPYRRHVGRGEREAASRRVARQQCPCVPSQEERVFVTRLEFSRRLRLRRPFALKQGASGGGDLDRARSPSLECKPAPNP